MLDECLQHEKAPYSKTTEVIVLKPLTSSAATGVVVLKPLTSSAATGVLYVQLS